MRDVYKLFALVALLALWVVSLRVAYESGYVGGLHNRSVIRAEQAQRELEQSQRGVDL